MNVWNFTRFHRYMVEQEFIAAKDFNVNILQGPDVYRIDILPLTVKQQLKADFEQHLEWLRTVDPLNRATGGFEAAIKFMMETDNSHLLPKFWETTSDLDWARDERLIDVVPELAAILEYKPAWTRV
jgi:hypothetical protein